MAIGLEIVSGSTVRDRQRLVVIDRPPGFEADGLFQIGGDGRWTVDCRLSGVHGLL